MADRLRPTDVMINALTNLVRSQSGDAADPSPSKKDLIEGIESALKIFDTAYDAKTERAALRDAAGLGRYVKAIESAEHKEEKTQVSALEKAATAATKKEARGTVGEIGKALDAFVKVTASPGWQEGKDPAALSTTSGLVNALEAAAKTLEKLKATPGEPAERAAGLVGRAIERAQKISDRAIDRSEEKDKREADADAEALERGGALSARGTRKEVERQRLAMEKAAKVAEKDDAANARMLERGQRLSAVGTRRETERQRKALEKAAKAEKDDADEDVAALEKGKARSARGTGRENERQLKALDKAAKDVDRIDELDRLAEKSADVAARAAQKADISGHTAKQRGELAAETMGKIPAAIGREAREEATDLAKAMWRAASAAESQAKKDADAAAKALDLATAAADRATKERAKLGLSEFPVPGVFAPPPAEIPWARELVKEKEPPAEKAKTFMEVLPPIIQGAVKASQHFEIPGISGMLGNLEKVFNLFQSLSGKPSESGGTAGQSRASAMQRALTSAGKGGGGPTPPGGAAAAGGEEGAAMAGAEAGAAAGPEGAILGAVLALLAKSVYETAKAFFELPSKMEAFATSVLESHRYLGEFNGRIANALGRLEVGDVHRNLQTGRETAGTNVQMIASLDSLRNSMQPQTIGWANFTNGLGALGAAIGDVIAVLTGPIFNILGTLGKLMAVLAKVMTENSGFQKGFLDGFLAVNPSLRGLIGIIAAVDKKLDDILGEKDDQNAFEKFLGAAAGTPFGGFNPRFRGFRP